MTVIDPNLKDKLDRASDKKNFTVIAKFRYDVNTLDNIIHYLEECDVKILRQSALVSHVYFSCKASKKALLDIAQMVDCVFIYEEKIVSCDRTET